MPPRLIQVTTGSRLHIGMFAFNAPATRGHGGVGFMVDQPRVRVQFRSHHELLVTGPAATRVTEVVRRVQQANWIPSEAGCAIEVLEMPRQMSLLFQQVGKVLERSLRNAWSTSRKGRFTKHSHGSTQSPANFRGPGDMENVALYQCVEWRLGYIWRRRRSRSWSHA